MARFSRAGFEDRIQTFVQQTINLTVSAVADAGLDGKAIDHTIMIGGSTRIPLVERRLAELFPKPKRAGDADAAMGAALHGSRLASDEWVRKTPNRASPPPEEAHRPAPPVARETDKWMELFEPHLRRASAAWKRRSHDEAISAIEDMLGVGRVCLAELYAKRGEDHANAHRYREAVEDYRRALEHNPGDRLVRAACHRALNRYASTLLQQGHLMQAREKIHESLVIEPKCENCRHLGEQIEAAIRQERDRQGYGKKRRR
jgi:tetratricopeptide (TPR) repeat protein